MSFDVTADTLPPGFLAIEASAGTGKTWTISHLVVRLLLTDPDLPLRGILVVTFTNAAADELAERIRRVLAACRSGGDTHADRLMALGEAALGGRAQVLQRLDACLSGLDELAVGTIHASCRRILERTAFACGEAFAADLAPDDGELVAGAVRDAWRSRLWADARLARLATAWTVEQDVRLWQRWNRHPGTRIEPRSDLPAALDSVESAAVAVRQLATPAAITELRSWQWKKQKDDEKPALAHLDAGGDPLDILAELKVLADPEKSVFKKFHHVALVHPLPAACRTLLEAVSAARIAWLGWLCPAVAERLRDRLAATGLWTQDDLLRRVRSALELRPGLAAAVRQRWPVALIDEFQDTDPVQWDIFRRCYDGSDARLVLVGDPKQAVYRFRGADLDAYLQAVQDRPVQRLSTNFRSDPALVTAVQRLIGHTTAPFLEPRIDLPAVEGVEDAQRLRLDDDGSPLTILLPDGEESPPTREDAVASEIVALLSGTRLGAEQLLPRDCAVLVRTGFQARQMQQALQARGVPATLAADGDVLDSPAAAELRCVLASLARPRDALALRPALATRAWGHEAAAIAALVADDARWQALADAIEVHHQCWQRHGLTAAIEAWDAAVGAALRFAALPDGERWLTDWRHAVEVLHGQAAAAGLRPAALLAWWDRRDSEDAESRRLRLEADASAVRLLTMHVAKGLEFPVVFCPYIGACSDRPDEGVLLKDAAGPRLVLGGPGLEAGEEVRQAEDDAEQLRLAYVALTRARVRAYVLWGMWDRRQGHYRLALQSAMGWWLRPDGQSHADWRAATGTHVDGREELLRDTFDCIIALRDAGAAIAMRSARPSQTRWEAPQPVITGDGLRRLPPPARARLDTPRMVTSFTGLLGGDGASERRHGDEPQLPVTADPAPPTALRALARGADVGDALHKVLEKWDFQRDPTTEVAAGLEALGLAAGGPRQPHAENPVAAVVASLHALAALPISCAGRELLLGAVPDRLRRAEWEFHLPLARVRPARVLALIEAHAAAPPMVLADLPRLRETAPGGGFLKGFVDLLACADEAWWVLDWKSNHLGDRPEDYDPERLWPAMAGHGYLVQALLYLLALHRHLRHRLGTGYSYERHVAGAAWVFLRGVDAGLGVWTWKPSEALVLALERELLEDRS